MQKNSRQWRPYVVNFHDLQFTMDRVLRPSNLGRATHRLVRFGMPRLNPQLARCVFYLYRLNPKTGEFDNEPHGTGFLVGRPSEAKGLYNIYGITNWHLAIAEGASIIRLNTTDGGTRLLKYDPIDWQFIPNQDDIAAIDLSDDLWTDDEISFAGEPQFISREALSYLEIGVGEDAFMIGLYADHDGGERNVPVGRFGNLAMVASETALVAQGNGIKRPSHLADMRSRSGFSGSPVFVYRVPATDLTRPPWWQIDGVLKNRMAVITSDNDPSPKDHFLGLLGVHCAQVWEETEVSKTPGTSKERRGDPIHEGDDLYIPGAMNVVVPAWSISELLNLEVFELARKQRLPEQQSRSAKNPRPESIRPSASESDPPASDANPNHREDFTSLLRAAVRKPEPKEKT